MKNCSNDVIKYHNDEVTLAETQRETMRERRNTNRARVKSGLAKMERTGPDHHVVQGSYAMKTMVQHPDNNYDIDDGAAFIPEQLKNKSGVALTAKEAKELLRDALLKDGKLPSDPKILNNCVRIEYAAGYHVDIPVYRTKTDAAGKTTYEIAGQTEWRSTNPKEIADWFDERVAATKQNGDNDPQLRRMVRLTKRFARANCGDADAPSGLILTVLVNDAHPTNRDREDEAFREVLRKIKQRIDLNWHVLNPRNIAEELTKAADQARIKLLSDKIGSALKKLEKLDEAGCSRGLARSTWDGIFLTDYFGKLESADRSSEAAGSKSPDKPVNKQGGGTYA
jgi:hypothetical protein